MRPLKIAMSAFGPYADKAEIDLDKLGKNGIYLITGDTGAGKTTIFDAITFALFGETSGGYKSPGMMRSKYAKLEIPTEVELTFEYQDKEYFIKRNPEYERPKSKGEGTTIEKPGAVLMLPDGKVIAKVSDVNEEIVNILGVDREQFSRICMIAQGDFLKLLLASTEERKEIFQKLFSTEKYARLQDCLKREAIQLGREYDGIAQSIRQYIEGINYSTDDELAEEAKRAGKGELPTDSTIELVEKLIEHDEEISGRLKEEESLAEKELEKIKDLLAEAKRIEELEKILEQAEGELKEKTAELEAAREHMEKEKSRTGDAEQLLGRIAGIRSRLPEYERLENERQILEKTKENLLQTEKLTADKEIICLDLEKKIAAAKKEKSGLENTAAELKDLEAKQKEISRELNTVSELEADLKDISIRQRNLTDAQNEYIKCSLAEKEASDRYERLHKAYLDEQAGIIASTLKDGEPCPVCGSEDHPKKAEISAGAPSKEELEKAKQISEAKNRERENQSSRAAEIKAGLEEKKETFKKKALEILNISDIENAGELLSEKKLILMEKTADIETELDEAEKKSARKKELDDSIPQLERSLDEQKAEKSSMTIKAAELKAGKENLEKSCRDLETNLKYSSREEAEKTISSLNEDREKIIASIDKAIADYSDCNNGIIKLETVITENKKKLSGRIKPDTEAETEKQQILSQKRTESGRLLTETAIRISNNRRILENITVKYREGKETEKKWQQIRALSDTANGNLNGKEKIMLETYVQMRFFDRILARANQRLLVMTGGQYELKRAGQAANNRSQSGLDLDVVDHNNGSLRNVRTLSGGEAFKASLSLALGLSDEIQSGAGGIKLDTMFVDEGFGSLDEESLHQAIEALADLSEGNRLVGIISHVAELKNRIDKQIIVTKEGSEGSKVRLEI